MTESVPWHAALPEETTSERVVFLADWSEHSWSGRQQLTETGGKDNYKHYSLFFSAATNINS